MAKASLLGHQVWDIELLLMVEYQSIDPFELIV